MKFALLGLGEAGNALASDLLAQGAVVYGWDPAPKHVTDGVHFLTSNSEAVQHSNIILSVNWASVSLDVAQEILPVLKPDQLFADMNTASPQTKQRIAKVLHPSGAKITDVAIMAPILPRGVGTPTLASGMGAHSFQQNMIPFGMPVTVIDDQPGSAATRKLLRSIFYKGVAAVILEAHEAAVRLNCESFMVEQMLTMIQDEETIDRLISGSHVHAQRRMHEMEAVSDMLREIGIPPYTSEASVQWLAHLQQQKENK